MSNYQAVFERHEKKYMLDLEQNHAFLLELALHMEQDRYGMHTVSSLYYDTEQYDIIRHSIEKPAYKEKLRLRSYGSPTTDNDVFLELKKKVNGIVYKRRIALPLQEAREYLNNSVHPVASGQIFQEIDWFVSRQESLLPRILLICDRVALYDREDPNLRITLDCNIRWRDYGLDLGQGHHGTSLIDRGQCLMEIKTARSMPVWLTHLLARHEIYPRSFSKYGTCYQTALADKGRDLRVG